MSKQLTPAELTFFHHFGWETGRLNHESEVLTWVRKNGIIPVRDMENLLIQAQEEKKDLFYWLDPPTEPFVVPFKDREEVLARNAEFAKDNT